MRMNLSRMAMTLALAAGAFGSANADEVSRPISERFQPANVEEVPNFQKHVVPLFGRLGCNGRACHGSFQGRGGFRLSLFGYDFTADHEALFDKESPRVDVDKPLESLIIAKPTDADMHEGGKRYDKDSWQYHVIRRWIEGGAKWSDSDVQKLASLQVTPAEIEFSKTGQTVQLKAIAVWADGTREDVTPLCRMQSNDELVAKIDQNGLVTSTEKGDTHLVVFYDKAVIPVPVIRPVSDLVGAKYPATPTPTKIDELIVAKLSKLGIVQSDVCTDAEFLRRVSLDLTATLPTADEVRAFIADASPDKRQKKVEELLETPAYAAWWTTKLCDFTTNNDQHLNNVGVTRGAATQDWWDWIHKRVADNMPYDQLAAGIIVSKSRQAGESYLQYCETLSKIARREDGRSFAERDTMPYYWARQNIRQPEEKAISFAYSFMAVRIECAQCHKHPFDQWSKDDFDQFKKFFTAVAYNQAGARAANAEDKKSYDELVAELDLNNEKFRNNNDRLRYLAEKIKEGKTVPTPEVVVNQPRKAAPRRNNDKVKGKNAQATPAVTARLLGDKEFDLTSLEDSRQPLMDWLRDKNNRFFARAFVNRAWANYFNVGIVSPTDDMNLANAPSNRPLLDYLTNGFIESGYNMKWVHREITNSRAYQLSWHTNDTNKLDDRNFSHAVPRRLPAEVAYDAVYSATVGDTRANTMRTDFKGRSIALPGSNARTNNNGPGFALSVFGRSTRETNCDCDRSMDASLLQTVYLQNDTETKSRIEARDSWVNQVTLQTAKEKSGDDNDGLAAQIKSLERRLERAKKQKDEDQIKKAEEQLAKLRKQVAPQKSASTKFDPEAVKPLVETAYLRTLSRFPSSDELATATQYVVDEGNLTSGLQDVLWALVNTKEFIVNH